MTKAAYSIVLWLNVPGPQARQEEETEYLGEQGEKPVHSRTHVFNAPAATRLVYGAYETHDEAKGALTDLESQLARDQAVHVGDKNDERATVYLIPAKSVYYAVLAATEHAQ